VRVNGATAKDVQRARRHLHGGRRLACLARFVGALAILLGGLGAFARGLLWLAGQSEIPVWPDRWQVTDIISDTMSVTLTVFGVCVILYVIGKGVAADGEL
jgi:hypothetical protein